MANLFDISKRYINILELAENPDIPSEVFEEALREMDGELNEKLENIVAFIRSLEGDVSTIKNEVDRLNSRKKAAENKINSLKRYMEECLRAVNKTKIKTSLNTISIQKNAPSVNVLDEKLIPKEFRKEEVVVSIDKKSILFKLKEGIEIEGCELKQTESLRIR